MVLPGEALRTHASDGLAHIFASLELPPPPGMHCLAAQLQAWLTASRDKTNESSRMAPETTLDPTAEDDEYGNGAAAAAAVAGGAGQSMAEVRRVLA